MVSILRVSCGRFWGWSTCIPTNFRISDWARPVTFRYALFTYHNHLANLVWSDRRCLICLNQRSWYLICVTVYGENQNLNFVYLGVLFCIGLCDMILLQCKSLMFERDKHLWQEIFVWTFHGSTINLVLCMSTYTQHFSLDFPFMHRPTQFQIEIVFIFLLAAWACREEHVKLWLWSSSIRA